MNSAKESVQSYAQQITGVWHHLPHPSAETNLLFCADGRGLLFIYSGGDDPYVDEFTWKVERAGEVTITWVHCHEYLADDDCETPEESTGKSETLAYTLQDTSPRTLLLDIGYHWCDDQPFTFKGTAGDYEEERQHWQHYAQHFSPFGPDRQVWLTDETGWHPVPGAQVVDEDGQRSSMTLTRSQHPFFDNPRVLQLALIFGILGLAGFISDYRPHLLPGATGLVMVMLPLVIILFADDMIDHEAWKRISLRIRQGGSAWYILMCLFAGILVVTGYHPRGWLFFFIFMGIGLLPTLRILLGKERS